MHHLSGKEKKQLRERLPQGYEVDKKDQITKKDNILYKDDKPFLIELEGKLMPHLKSLPDNAFKAVYVDHGAIPFLVKGADMMKPGIQKIEDGFEKGDIVIVRDEVKSKNLALGFALFNSEDMKKQESGKSVKIYHYFGDSYY